MKQRAVRTPHGHSYGWLSAIFHFHGHGEELDNLGSDPALVTDEGIRTVWLALAALGFTTIIQIAIVAFNGGSRAHRR